MSFLGTVLVHGYSPRATHTESFLHGTRPNTTTALVRLHWCIDDRLMAISCEMIDNPSCSGQQHTHTTVPLKLMSPLTFARPTASASASTAIQFTLRQLSREEVLFSGLAVLLLLLLHFLSIHRNTRRVQDSGYTREGCCNLFHSVVLCKEFRGCWGKHWRAVKDSPESGSAKNVLLSNISPFTASSLWGRKTG